MGSITLTTGQHYRASCDDSMLKVYKDKLQAYCHHSRNVLLQFPKLLFIQP